MVERFCSEQVCPDCRGSRVNEFARFVRFGELRFPELTSRPVEELVPLLRSAEVSKRQSRIARDLLTEIERRAEFLVEVGLGYLTLTGADTSPEVRRSGFASPRSSAPDPGRPTS